MFVIISRKHCSITEYQFVGAETPSCQAEMKRASRTLVYRRITLILILCTALIFCFEISVNPTVFNMAYNVDRKWAAVTGNITSVHLTFTRPSTVRLENIPNPFKTVDEQRKASPKITITSAIRHSTVTKQVTNVTRRKTGQIYSAKNVPNRTHPNENDRLRIANGQYNVEDLMTVGPFQFLKNYKNPCWVHAIRNRTEPAIRCLPYFYLVGAPKAGTTDMHSRLVQHPDISRLVTKEPHWLTRKHYYSRKTRSSFEDYTKMFTYATREIILKKDADGYHNRVLGDCSASTMWDNDYWTILPQYQNLSEPKYTNADYIHHFNPRTKIIAMLRNPVDRLYSDYLFFQHGSPQMFHKGVVETINATHECLKRYTLRMCLYTPQSFYMDVKVRLRIGVYHLHLKEFLRVFPRDQVMVIKLEDFSNKTVSYMQKIFAFLELPELEAKAIQKIANPKKHANSRRAKDKKAGDILAHTRRMLQEFYRPHNDLLTELLGDQFDYNSDSVS